MATDYDEVRPDVAEARKASLDAVKTANAPDARSVSSDLEEADTSDGVELPGGDLSGEELIRRLARLGYGVTRQTGSHLRLTCAVPIAHHVTVPRHDPLRIGTLATILAEVATAHSLPREDLLRRLFD